MASTGDMIKSSIRATIEAINGFNGCVAFFQWLQSQRPHLNGAENQELKEDDVLKLQTSLQYLEDTLPVMCELIDRAEWKSHEKYVEKLLLQLKDAVCDGEDIVQVFRYYELKVKIEGSATSMEPGSKFFHDVIQGNLKKLNHIKERLDNLSRLLERFGLQQATPRFDKSVRPETTGIPTEANIFGRDDEVRELIRLLGVPAINRRGPPRSKRKRSVPVLPIVGIGGVGKTTLAQTICSHPRVKEHFDVKDIAWICVSDDFDVKRLTKEAIEQFSGKAPNKDNLNSLQADLAHCLNKRRFLIVLDDMWAENGELWKTFYAPFKDVLEGSMMLVTTRSKKVAGIVGTMDPFLLEGLDDNVFQDFFKLCVFGSNSTNNSPELERIGEQILPKLKGSPLAAKTLGRLLGMSFDPAHWNMILNSQLWELGQEGTDILPALRLSYMYLPFHLKRCFSFCAVFPKDYNFVKEDLAEFWVEEGFVEAQGNIPLQQTACKYFEELAHLSFFQKFREKYVMHDLIHDMAQLVSKDECFIIKDKKDLERIPQNVRHLSVLESSDFQCFDLKILCKHTKLRTILCYMRLDSQDGINVLEKWCTELLCMRVMVFASFPEYLSGIGNMKNLRCLKIMNRCFFWSIPAAFCSLYNLEVLCAGNTTFLDVPRGFSNLINLQKFESGALSIDAAMGNGEGMRLLKNFNLITEVLFIRNVCEISKDDAAEIELMKKDSIYALKLAWSGELGGDPGPPKHNEMEVFQALHPPTSIISVQLCSYPGENLPSWSRGSDTTMFSSLTEILVSNCPRLSSIEPFIHPAYMPAIKQITVSRCKSLESVPTEMFRNLHSLETLCVSFCPKLKSLRTNNLKSLRKLEIMDCKDIASIGAPQGIAHIPEVRIENCPKLKEVQQPLEKGY